MGNIMSDDLENLFGPGPNAAAVPAPSPAAAMVASVTGQAPEKTAAAAATAPAAGAAAGAPKARGRPKKAETASPTAAGAPNTLNEEQKEEYEKLRRKLLNASIICPEHLPRGYVPDPNATLAELRAQDELLQLRLASSNSAGILCQLNESVVTAMEGFAEAKTAMGHYVEGWGDEVEERRPNFENIFKNAMVEYPWLAMMGPLVSFVAEHASALSVTVNDNRKRKREFEQRSPQEQEELQRRKVEASAAVSVAQ
jgi:hypothetical protein